MKTIKEIISEGSNNDKILNAFDKIKDALGADTFLDELYRAMSEDNLKDYLEYIARNHEIKINI